LIIDITLARGECQEDILARTEIDETEDIGVDPTMVEVSWRSKSPNGTRQKISAWKI
jgi:hypothetical protein